MSQRATRPAIKEVFRQGSLRPGAHYKKLIDEACGNLNDISRQAAVLQHEATSSTDTWELLSQLQESINHSTSEFREMLNPTALERELFTDLGLLERDEQEYQDLTETLSLEYERAQKDLKELECQDARTLNDLHNRIESLEAVNSGFGELLGLDISPSAEQGTIEVHFREKPLKVVLQPTSSGLSIVKSDPSPGNQAGNDMLHKLLQLYITGCENSGGQKPPDLASLILLAHCFAEEPQAIGDLQ